MSHQQLSSYLDDAISSSPIRHPKVARDRACHPLLTRLVVPIVDLFEQLYTNVAEKGTKAGCLLKLYCGCLCSMSFLMVMMAFPSYTQLLCLNADFFYFFFYKVIVRLSA